MGASFVVGGILTPGRGLQVQPRHRRAAIVSELPLARLARGIESPSFRKEAPYWCLFCFLGAE